MMSNPVRIPTFQESDWKTTAEAAVYLRKFEKDGSPSEQAVRTAVCRGYLKPHKWHRRVYTLKGLSFTE